eukprot:5534263-Pleurochrysis_carterae.AAC.1
MKLLHTHLPNVTNHKVHPHQGSLSGVQLNPALPIISMGTCTPNRLSHIRDPSTLHHHRPPAHDRSWHHARLDGAFLPRLARHARAHG